MEKSSIQNFDLELQNNEEYSKVNKVYEDTLANSNKTIIDFFEQIQKIKELAIADCFESIKSQYKEYTQNFEDGVRSITESLSTINKEDSVEVKRLKRRTDDIMGLISEEEMINSYFHNIIQKLDKKLANLSIKQIKDPKYNFSLMGKEGSFFWKGTESSIMEVPPGGSSYKCYVSEELFYDELSFTVKFNRVNNGGSLNSTWMYTFGLMKQGCESNQSSFYNDSCLLHSNGSLSEKFSGNSGSEIKCSIWKEGDEMTVSRNSNNEVYFTINKEERVLGFTDVKGSMRVVIGFSSSFSDDIFEIVDCNKSFV